MVKLDWLSDDARLFLKRGYLNSGKTIEQRYKTISDTIEKISRLKGISDRFLSYIEKGWISFSSPVLSNFGEKDNLPVSCNFGMIYDNLDSILSGLHEMGMLAKYGAGTAKNFSKIRALGSPISTGGKSEGIIPWIELYAKAILSVTQGSIRRGFLTAYLSVNHLEILDFLDIGTEGHHIQNITTGVTIPKGWMQSLIEGDKRKRKIWAKILKCRNDIGFPYILFEENCNKNCSPAFKLNGDWLDNSNICSEVLGISNDEKEFSCCLSSVNLYHFDEWSRDPDFIFDINIALDCVIEEYIQKGKKLKGLEKAVKFSEEHRTVGLGVLGFHSYLQKNNIVFGSLESYRENNKIFSYIRKESDRASRWMAENWGEPLYVKGLGFRNDSRIAIAPTKSTSFIMGGYSPGIEPIKSNFHEKTLAKIQVEYKNPELVKLLQSIDKDTDKVWRSILENNGSVQKLEFLTDHDKEVFKTFSEISQLDVIKLAAQRQKYIDQSQSLNLMIHPKTSPKDLNKLMLTAYEEGIKTLYYQYSINAAQEFNRQLLECSACDG